MPLHECSKKQMSSGIKLDDTRGKEFAGFNQFGGLVANACAGSGAALHLNNCNCSAAIIPSAKSPLHVTNEFRVQNCTCGHPLYK